MAGGATDGTVASRGCAGAVGGGVEGAWLLSAQACTSTEGAQEESGDTIMADPAREKIVDRVKKLLSMTRSDNENEAAMALAAATKLMTDYQIELDEIDPNPSDGLVVETERVPNGEYWLIRLADSAARLYDCRAAFTKGSPLWLHFYGTPVDVAVARQTFWYIYRTWQTIVDRELKSLRIAKDNRDDHGRGFTDAIRYRVSALIEERAAIVKSKTGRDIVVSKRTATEAFFKSKVGGKGAPLPPIKDHRVHAQGAMAGQEVQFESQIGGKCDTSSSPNSGVSHLAKRDKSRELALSQINTQRTSVAALSQIGKCDRTDTGGSSHLLVCEMCGGLFTGRGDARTCSPTCRQRLSRARRAMGLA
jgi:Protein of unknown function (DUF2786)